MLLTVASHVMFPWEKKSACCNKAFSFAVSIFQRFKTIGNTHHLLPKGLLASKIIFLSAPSFFWHLGPVVLGRAARPSLAGSPGGGEEEEAV